MAPILVWLPDFTSLLKSGPFANQLFLTIQNVYASRFRIPTVQAFNFQTISQLKSFLDKGRSVVVDNTHADADAR